MGWRISLERHHQSKLRLSPKTDGTQVGGFNSPGPGPQHLAWDGAYLWLSDSSANYVYQLKTNGTQVSGFASPTSEPRGLGWDGVYFWHSGRSINYIYQLKTDGTQVGGFNSPAPNPGGGTWTGAYLWIPTNAYTYKLGNANNFNVNYRIFAK